MTQTAVKRHIEKKLHAAFAPIYLEVINESDNHHVPPGSESHFKIVIVSEYFAKERPLARHRAIYRVLADELAHGVHALALHTYSDAEYQKQQTQIPQSPRCLGGGERG